MAKGATKAEIDRFYLEALDDMLAADPRVNEPLRFVYYFQSLLAVDALGGGIWASDITTHFAEHNIGPNQTPFLPACFPANEAITSIVESDPGNLTIYWHPVDDVSSYTIIGSALNWNDYHVALGDYFVVAEGLTDTTWVYDSRDDMTEYLFAIVPVDADGYDGYRSDPVFVAPLVPTGVDETVPGPNTQEGRWLCNSPNPFNPSTTFYFETKQPTVVRVLVYDLAGRLVRDFGTQQVAAGRQSVVWNGVDDKGRAMSSGVYLVRLDGRDWSDTGRIALIR